MSTLYRILGFFWGLAALACIGTATFANVPVETDHYLITVSLLSMLLADNYNDKAPQ